MNASLDSGRFYDLLESYHGHQVGDLEAVHDAVRPASAAVIFLAGDSSLDNKFWIRGDQRWQAAVGAYSQILRPARMVADISYHLNVLGQHGGGGRVVTINAAVEESTLRSRARRLNAHDEFIRDHLRPNDIVVVSVGGNDVALRSTMATKASMSMLIYMNSAEDIAARSESCWGMNHFVRMFRDDLQKYVDRLTCRTRPKKVLICQ